MNSFLLYWNSLKDSPEKVNYRFISILNHFIDHALVPLIESGILKPLCSLVKSTSNKVVGQCIIMIARLALQGL